MARETGVGAGTRRAYRALILGFYRRIAAPRGPTASRLGRFFSPSPGPYIGCPRQSRTRLATLAASRIRCCGLPLHTGSDESRSSINRALNVNQV
jgi:hypothetical protein